MHNFSQSCRTITRIDLYAEFYTVICLYGQLLSLQMMELTIKGHRKEKALKGKI